MFYVYALHSKAFGKIYIGFTSNLQARILSHNNLSKKGFTSKYRPRTLIHVEEFQSKTEAIRREKELKSAKRREFIRNLLNN